MGKTSNASKQKWVSENYKQIKILVTPAVAEAFKTACAALGQSVNKTLSMYMESVSREKPSKPAPVLRIATRPQRRKALQAILVLLCELRDAESGYNENIPENLRGGERYEHSIQSVEILEEAIGLLEEAF